MNSKSILMLNDWASTFGPTLWRATWQGGVFIVAIWVVCRLFRQIPPSVRHWLWWVASLQLLVRLVVVTPVALAILPAKTQLAVAPTIGIQSDASDASHFISESPTPEYPPQQKTSPVASLQKAAPPRARPSILLIALAAWLCGVGFCLLNAARRMFRTWRLLQSASHIHDDDLADIVIALSSEVGVRVPRLRESTDAPCPLLGGWFRPTIVLPLGAMDSLAEPELGMAIAHELTHLKRCDLWLGIVPAVAQIVFFFHPLAWLASSETEAAREEACDLEAMRLGGGSPASYARLLLNSAQAGSSAAVMGSAFGYRLIQRRITMLNTSFRPNGAPSGRAFYVLIAIGAVCALPWTVTAQSTKAVPATKATHAKKAKPTRKVTLARERKPTKHAISIGMRYHAVAARMRVLAAPTAMGVNVVPPLALAPVAPGPRMLPLGVIGHRAPSAPMGVGSLVMPPTALAAPLRNVNPTTIKLSAPSAPSLMGRMAKIVPALKLYAPDAMPSPAMAPLLNLQIEPPRFKVPTVSIASTDPLLFFVKCQGSSLKDVLKELFDAGNIDYELNSSVLDDKVTVSLHNKPLEYVIEMILQSVKQKLTYRVERGTYQIFPARAE